MNISANLPGVILSVEMFFKKDNERLAFRSLFTLIKPITVVIIYLNVVDYEAI